MSVFPCRLYISAPAGHPVNVLTSMLEDVLAAHDVAAVLFSTGNQATRECASALMQCTIAHGAAFIVEQDITLAREIGADGVHIAGTVEAYNKARSELGDNRIVGLTTALNRHDSMCIGETGADYIFFDPDVPNSPNLKNGQSLESLISWWSGLFEIPCIARAQHDGNQNRALIKAGVDFLSLDNSLWTSRENTTNILKYIGNLIAECGREQ